jgi:hypothetical protein
MSLSTLLVIVAAVASLLMVLQLTERVVPIIGLLAAIAEVLLRFGVVRLSINGVNLPFVLAVTLLASGAYAWSKSSNKGQVTTSTLVALVGGLQVYTSVIAG